MLHVQDIADQDVDDSETIDHTSPEIDRRGFWKVACHNRHFPKKHVACHPLGNDLGIEHKVITVGLKLDRFQVFS